MTKFGKELIESLQQAKAHAEELRRLAQEGIDSGPGIEADDVYARLRARFGQPRAK